MSFLKFDRCAEKERKNSQAVALGELVLSKQFLQALSFFLAAEEEHA
jgi:hypothetical protein